MTQKLGDGELARTVSGSSSDTELPETNKVEPESKTNGDVQSVETESEQSAAGLPLDQVFEILKNKRRRYVLQYLKEVDGPVSIGELSEEIAALENDKSVGELSSSERKRVYVGLYQCHLPKMDGMDIVSFNKPRGIIESGENAHVFDEYLETDDAEDPEWYKYYAGLSLGSVFFLGGMGVLASMTAVPFVDLGVVLVVAAFGAVSLAHFRAERAGDERSDDGNTNAQPE